MSKATVIESDKPFEGLADKIRLIRDFYVSSLRYPSVRAFAERAAMDNFGNPSVVVLFVALKAQYRYVPDQVGVETIKAPWNMVRDMERQGWAAGDCDDAACLAYALLRSVGVPAELAVGWYGGQNPTHIFTLVPLKDGSRLPFDLVAPQLGVTKRGAEHVEIYG